MEESKKRKQGRGMYQEGRVYLGTWELWAWGKREGRHIIVAACVSIGAKRLSERWLAAAIFISSFVFFPARLSSPHGIPHITQVYTQPEFSPPSPPFLSVVVVVGCLCAYCCFSFLSLSLSLSLNRRNFLLYIASSFSLYCLVLMFFLPGLPY